ncbi:MAG: RND transporter, partial [Methylococcus sp.]
MKLRTLVLIIMAVSGSGCMIGPDYLRPEIDTPQAYRFEPKQAAATADSEWW